MAKRPEPLPPRASELIALIRRLASAGRITFREHALERAEERDIGIADVLEVFRLGDIEGAITAGDNPGEWKCLVVGNVKWTPREIGAVTVVAQRARLVIITIEWMDP